MSKILISESTLKNLIQQVLKEVLDEKFTFQKPKPGERTIAQRMSHERGERQIARQLKRCLSAIANKREAIMAYEADPDRWSKGDNNPQNFILKMQQDESAMNYFNGMLLSRSKLGPSEDSWMYNTLKALGDKCPGQ